MSVFDKLIIGHLFILFGVMGISGQHDDGVGQREEFLGVLVVLLVLVKVGLGELPHYALDLLGLTG